MREGGEPKREKEKKKRGGGRGAENEVRERLYI